MELKITKELIDNYIKYVCIYRVKSGYKAISEIKDEKTEKQLREDYKIGGIQKWLANKLHLSLDELGTLESNEDVLNEKEKIDKLFSNQFNSNINRKEGFGSFQNFYNWYLEQEDKCYYCGITSGKLKSLFNSKKLASTKFNETLHIEQIDAKQGYNRKNCRLACSLCNNAKSDLISKENYKDYFSKAMENFLNDLHQNKIENIISYERKES